MGGGEWCWPKGGCGEVMGVGVGREGCEVVFGLVESGGGRVWGGEGCVFFIFFSEEG